MRFRLFPRGDGSERRFGHRHLFEQEQTEVTEYRKSSLFPPLPPVRTLPVQSCLQLGVAPERRRRRFFWYDPSPIVERKARCENLVRECTGFVRVQADDQNRSSAVVAGGHQEAPRGPAKQQDERVTVVSVVKRAGRFPQGAAREFTSELIQNR